MCPSTHYSRTLGSLWVPKTMNKDWTLRETLYPCLVVGPFTRFRVYRAYRVYRV